MKTSKFFFNVAILFFLSFVFNFSYAGGVFNLNKDIKIYNYSKSSKNLFQRLFQAWPETFSIENPFGYEENKEVAEILYHSFNRLNDNILLGYKIDSEGIDRILNSLFYRYRPLYLLAVKDSPTGDPVSLSTLLLYTGYTGKAGAEFMSRQEFKKWLEKEGYDFLATFVPVKLKPKANVAFFAFKMRVFNALNGKIITRVVCDCYERDMLFDAF